MIKRLNKNIAMVIATASIVSLVPSVGVSASTNSVTRLESQEGEIDNAIAYKDGKYIFEGYQNDDESALYYYTGSTVKTLENSDEDELDNANLIAKYGDKYVQISDDDEYLVDLNTGKVLDDDAITLLDDAKTSLKKQLKKADDRYSVESDNDISLFEEVSNRSFGDVYYSYEAKGENGKVYTGFTNKTGNYVDASYTANIYAYSTEKGKVVKVEKFDNEDKNTKLTASLDSLTVIGQDKDYIYALSTITVEDGNIIDNTNTTTASSATIGVSKAVTGTYIQKISKAQGNKEDETYLPKSVTSYQVNNGIFDDSNADRADKAINEATDYFIKGDSLFAVKGESDSITVTKLVLKKTNDKFETAPTGVTADSKQSIQIVQADDSDDSDMETSSSYDVDADGNLWVLNSGKIYKYTGSSFDQVYKCDSSFDRISVYDKANLIVWATDSEEFATASGMSGTSDVEVDTKDPTEAVVKAETSKLQADVDYAKALVATLEDETLKTELTNRLTAIQVIATNATVVGWNKNNVTGQWSYADANKNILKNQWVQDNGTWYFLNADGAMATGWNKVGADWYYLNSNGSMATGWVQDNGAWYFLTSSGVMKTGWVKVESNWYFLNDNGSMASNTTVGGYELGANGAWIQ